MTGPKKVYTKTERRHLFKLICSLYTDPDRSLQAACNEVNVPAGDFHQWVSRIAEFAEHFKTCQVERATIERNRLLAAARAGLKELATGRIIELAETTTDGAGNVVSVVKRQKFYRPDPSVCMYVANLPTPTNPK